MCSTKGGDVVVCCVVVAHKDDADVVVCCVVFAPEDDGDVVVCCVVFAPKDDGDFVVRCVVMGRVFVVGVVTSTTGCAVLLLSGKLFSSVKATLG